MGLTMTGGAQEGDGRVVEAVELRLVERGMADHLADDGALGVQIGELVALAGAGIEPLEITQLRLEMRDLDGTGGPAENVLIGFRQELHIRQPAIIALKLDRLRKTQAERLIDIRLSPISSRLPALSQ